MKKKCIVSLEFSFITTLLPDLIAVFAERRQQVSFSTAIGNVKLMHECFPKHLSMETARMKYEIETEKNVRIKE